MPLQMSFFLAHTLETESVVGLNPELLMSALGQKRTLHCIHLMSALPPKADIWLMALEKFAASHVI